MRLLIFFGNVLLSIACSILAGRIEPLIDRLAQSLMKRMGRNFPK